LTLKVQRLGGTTGAATVDFATLDAYIPGMRGERAYAPKAGTLHFPDGVLEQTLSIGIPDDGVFKASEEFRVVLVNATGGTTIDPRYASIRVSVVDNESLWDSNTPSVGVGGAGCFIATAAYGSYLDPHVATLRAFRDRYLLGNAPGRAFVAWYYRVSPPAAAIIRRHALLRASVRAVLTPLVFAVAYPGFALAIVSVLGALWWRRRTSARCG
jgi:hypothetical protein